MYTLLLLASNLLLIDTLKLHAQVKVKDSLALVDLYNSTDGPHWINHVNWLTKQPVPYWNGVHVTGNRVTEISLYGNKLSGTIPSSLGNLSKLQSLVLFSNQLTGSIP